MNNFEFKKFRYDINALRTISVLLVLLYHIGQYPGAENLFKSGFIGVDIFFVISGFLVGGPLIEKYNLDEKINFKYFFFRRLRRIIPALIICLILTCFFSIILLDNHRVKETVSSAISAVFIWSNFFWDTNLSAYDTESSAYKLLVHTWSLSIEEQFYLFFPLIILFFSKINLRKYLGGSNIILILFFGSLLYVIIISLTQDKNLYFSTFARLWELLAGVLARLISIKLNSLKDYSKIDYNKLKYIRFFIECLVIILIFYISIQKNIIGSYHPGIITLLVVLPIVIILSTRSQILNYIGSIYFINILGKSSYSIYLYHVPIFVFMQLLGVYFNFFNSLIAISLSIILGIASYYFVEKIFLSNKIKDKHFTIIIISLLILLLTIYFVSIKTKLINSPLYNLNFDTRYDGTEIDNRALQMDSGIFSVKIKLDKFPNLNWAEASYEDWFLNEKSIKILLVGNSPSQNFYGSFVANQLKFKNYEFARFGVLPGNLNKIKIDQILNSPNFKKADIVLFNGLFGMDAYDKVFNFLESSVKKGKKTIFAQQVIFKRVRDEKTLSKTLPSQANYISIIDKIILNSNNTLSSEKINNFAFQNLLPNSRKMVEKFREDSEKVGAIYLDKYDFMCNQKQKICYVVHPLTKKKLIFDHHHWTAEGQKFYGQKLLESGWLSRLFE